ncbi:hypothetical protein KCP71_16480 [Salmonella enterica subsp. enterica]|nr:hypothetical protein KCP71_16480 [Salmonella enterica subsp. enterica]
MASASAVNATWWWRATFRRQQRRDGCQRKARGGKGCWFTARRDPGRLA